MMKSKLDINLGCTFVICDWDYFYLYLDVCMYICNDENPVDVLPEIPNK